MLKEASNKRIGIDMDDVLSYSMHGIIEILKKDYSIEIAYDDIYDYRIYNIESLKSKGININNMIDIWTSLVVDNHHLIHPIEGSIKALHELKKQSYELYIITARWESILKDTTIEWIEKFFPGIFTEVLFSGSQPGVIRSKHEICNEKDIKVMIEDDIHNCKILGENGVKCYLFNKPWNINIKEDDTMIKRINTWDEII